jgi:hypothetical protein
MLTKTNCFKINVPPPLLTTHMNTGIDVPRAYTPFIPEREALHVRASTIPESVSNSQGSVVGSIKRGF